MRRYRARTGAQTAGAFARAEASWTRVVDAGEIRLGARSRKRRSIKSSVSKFPLPAVPERESSQRGSMQNMQGNKFPLAPSREPAPALAGKRLTLLRNSMSAPKITICPPGPERPGLRFDKAQFTRSAAPVKAEFVGANNGENGWSSTGISFGDYNSMTTGKSTRGSGRCGEMRRLPTPDFMLDEKRFRTVVVRFLEIRAGLTEQSGTLVERTERLTPVLKRRAEWAASQLDRWCAKYVKAIDDTAERKHCQRHVEEYDATVRICRQPSVIPQMARVYYLEGLHSVAVGERVGFKASHVRQILHRLRLLDAEMQAGSTDHRAKGEWQATERASQKLFSGSTERNVAPVLPTHDNYWAQRQEEWKRQGLGTPW
jgi:hypothetical protein